jgi:hypothetical protein
MNPFRKLGELVEWVLGADLSDPPASQAPAPRPRPPAEPGVDGFDRPARAPISLGNTFTPRVERLEVEPRPPPGQVMSDSAFVASLDDLHLVDEAMEPNPEFIPEGGMSTESLMREFDSLDPELQAQAISGVAPALNAEPQGSMEAPPQIDALQPPADAVPPHAASVTEPRAEAIGVAAASEPDAAALEPLPTPPLDGPEALPHISTLPPASSPGTLPTPDPPEPTDEPRSADGGAAPQETTRHE